MQFCFKYYTVFIYFCDFIFSSSKQWLGPRHRFHFYIDNFILLLSVTIGNTYLADTSYYSPGSFGKRMAVSGSLSSLWKISLNLAFVDGESVSSSYRKDHTSTFFYIFSIIKQLFGLNLFCETLGFWGVTEAQMVE